MQEKRNFPRFRLTQLIEMNYARETFLAGTALNLSEGGLLVQTEKNLEPYTKMFVMLSFGEGQTNPPLSCEALVLRCDKAGDGWQAGLEFQDLTTEQRAILRQVLAQPDREPA